MRRRSLQQRAMGLVPPYGRHGKIYLWRPLVLIGVVGLLLGMTTGTAFAFIGSNGRATTTGKVSIGSITSVSVAAVDSPSAPLLPGAEGDVVFSVTNPNRSPLSLVGVALAPGAGIHTDRTTCTATDGGPVVTLSVPPDDLPVMIPAKATKTIDLADAAAMDATAASDCQGASFTIPLTLTVEP